MIIIWHGAAFTSSISKAKPAGDQADPSFATTLAHGLDVLAAFRNGTGSLSNAELALHTGLSRPTVSRLTYTLAQLGYLKRNAKGRFELGPRHPRDRLSGAVGAEGSADSPGH